MDSNKGMSTRLLDPSAVDLSSSSSLVPYRQGFVQRSFAPLTAGGIRQSTFTLISTAMGGGVLCLPYVMKQVGIINGVLLLSISSLIAFVTMYILIMCTVRVNKHSYGSLLGYCAGKWVAPVLDIILFFYGMGAVIAYFILLGDFLPALFQLVGVTVASRTICMVGAAAFAVPLVLPRRLSALQYVSPVATFSLILTAAITMVKARGQASLLPPEAPMDLLIFGWPLLKCFTITLFAYICHMNVVPVAGELVDPTPTRVLKVTSRVAFVQLSFYIVIGVAGYISFSHLTNQNYITNYSSGDVLISLCRLSLSCSLLFSLPINTNPTAKAAVHFFQSVRELMADSRGDNLLGRRRVLSSADVENASERATRIFFSFFVLAVTLTIAILVPGVADVVSLLGGSLGTIIMIICPVYIFITIMRSESKTILGQIVVWSLILAALVAMTAVCLMVTNSMKITHVPLAVN
ncbi:transmembrane amino acid transporter, putative [Perkinsus marinus ATCC 50983]|uniref:Transmembrane amino acid transporter, putative n=1 Tax=Perkinsus marinus (strain ATCC 50983 / TXsc) TaxID=423536 RepID=C5L2Q6_PERM5|nr:transmembrane amino acid transporter, putative [Perkinsus marinus ATCC 50983]EER08971.1 transmembrane amino acid transporter, putative [Perkinsus marinus ATCC 50983]|eukprot:XP_002777155.1 transmembrane amino acid transporter, putative [Perkinsus marinus ATCC 50983]